MLAWQDTPSNRGADNRFRIPPSPGLSNTKLVRYVFSFYTSIYNFKANAIINVSVVSHNIVYVEYTIDNHKHGKYSILNDGNTDNSMTAFISQVNGRASKCLFYISNMLKDEVTKYRGCYTRLLRVLYRKHFHEDTTQTRFNSIFSVLIWNQSKFYVSIIAMHLLMADHIVIRKRIIF